MDHIPLLINFLPYKPETAAVNSVQSKTRRETDTCRGCHVVAREWWVCVLDGLRTIANNSEGLPLDWGLSKEGGSPRSGETEGVKREAFKL